MSMIVEFDCPFFALRYSIGSNFFVLALLFMDGPDMPVLVTQSALNPAHPLAQQVCKVSCRLMRALAASRSIPPIAAAVIGAFFALRSATKPSQTSSLTLSGFGHNSDALGRARSFVFSSLSLGLCSG